MTYVLDNIPDSLDAELRRKAAAAGKTVPQLMIEQLQNVNEPEQPQKMRDLSDVAGTWVDDPVYEEIRNYFEQIDPEFWK